MHRRGYLRAEGDAEAGVAEDLIVKAATCQALCAVGAQRGWQQGVGFSDGSGDRSQSFGGARDELAGALPRPPEGGAGVVRASCDPLGSSVGGGQGDADAQAVGDAEAEFGSGLN